MNTVVTKRFKDPKVDGLPFTRRPSHLLDLVTARQWVKDDVLGPEATLGTSSYTRWKFTLEAWVDERLKAGHLNAAALIIELLNAGMVCRVYGTRQHIETVAELWVRCHNEAGVKCEACR